MLPVDHRHYTPGRLLKLKNFVTLYFAHFNHFKQNGKQDYVEDKGND